MKQCHKLWIMGGILALIVVLTLSVFLMDRKIETIRESGEEILSIPADSVTGLSWDYEGEVLSFTKSDIWHYDQDPDFPVSALDLENMLDPFEHLTAAFRIEDVEDFSQYGFDDPVCTITIATTGETCKIRLGAYSQMDQQRYVDIGDGNVYLLYHDPMMEFDLGLRDVIQNDDLPYLEEADRITIRGAETYCILRQPEDRKSFREEDLYFAEKDGKFLPLDNAAVKNYLDALALTGLSNYETYTASQEDISRWGLDHPELTVRVDYTLDQEENQDGSQWSYTLSLARDPEVLQKAEKAADPDSVSVPVYARVDGSELVYQITPAEYQNLMACSYHDLRHREIFPASTEDIGAIDVILDGNQYHFESQADKEDLSKFTFKSSEIEITPILTALSSLRAEEFTEEIPREKKEISLNVLLNSGDHIRLELYRKDGAHCIAKVDGTVIALVSRSQVVDLMEQIRTIVLSPSDESSQTETTVS